MTMLMKSSTVGIYNPNGERVKIAGSMSAMGIFRQLSFYAVRRLFQIGESILILILGSRSKTHGLVLVHEELSHQNGDEALALVEQGQGDLVPRELAAGRCPSAVLGLAQRVFARVS